MKILEFAPYTICFICKYRLQRIQIIILRFYLLRKLKYEVVCYLLAKCSKTFVNRNYGYFYNNLSMNNAKHNVVSRGICTIQTNFVYPLGRFYLKGQIYFSSITLDGTLQKETARCDHEGYFRRAQGNFLNLIVFQIY